MPAFRPSQRDLAAQCLRVSYARKVSVVALFFFFLIWVAKFLARFLMTPYKGLVHANFEFQLMPIDLFWLENSCWLVQSGASVFAVALRFDHIGIYDVWGVDMTLVRSRVLQLHFVYALRSNVRSNRRIDTRDRTVNLWQRPLRFYLVFVVESGENSLWVLQVGFGFPWESRPCYQVLCLMIFPRLVKIFPYLYSTESMATGSWVPGMPRARCESRSGLSKLQCKTSWIREVAGSWSWNETRDNSFRILNRP